MLGNHARWLLLLGLPATLACASVGRPRPAATALETARPAPAPAALASAAPVPADTAVTLVAEGDGELPTSWSTVFGHHLSGTQARALVAERTAALAGALATDAGRPTAEDLARVTERLDGMSRAYATAFHASDATVPDKIAAAAEAATLTLAWARRLDALGLRDSAGEFRTDPRVGFTFEDVTEGPGRHWRSEGLALARLCLVLARREGDRPAAARCEALVADEPAAVRRIGVRGCACDPGDPLCSSSMSGWCYPGR